MKHAALLFLLVGCTVGEVPIGGGGTDGGGGDGGGGDGGNQLACVNRLPPASVALAHDHGGGDTRAGQSCIDAGCHAPGGAQPFGAGGTLYQADGVTPSTGATIRIFPAGSMTPITAITDSAGNFYFGALQINDLSFPARTEVTVCPNTRPMVSQILTGPGAGGNCNSAGCHAPGGTGVIKE